MLMNDEGEYVINFHTPQWEAFTTQATEILFGGSAGGGKAISTTSTPIITSEGFKKMKDIHIGDSVYDEKGKKCNVIAESEIMTDKDTYEVHFDDGAMIIAAGDHQWYTMTAEERARDARRTKEYREKRNKKRPSRGRGLRPDLALNNKLKKQEYLLPLGGLIRTTEEIKDTLLIDRDAANHSVPIMEAMEGEHKQLPIDPYVLGAWLADGSHSGGNFATEDYFVVDKIKQRGYDINKTKSPKAYEYYIRGFIKTIKAVGLYKNKHIPTEYLTASYKQRLELLQGMMDSDGTIETRGKAELSLSLEPLARDFHYLINSMGIKSAIRQNKSYLNGENKKDRYRMVFTTNVPVFSLPRKACKIKPTVNPRNKVRYIKNIVQIEREPVKCIEVDSPNHLFVVGRECIPTHNSHLMRYAAILYCIAVPNLQVYLFRRSYPELMKNHMEGSTSFPAILQPLVERKICKINYSKHFIVFDNGARINLCHCRDEAALRSYQGSEIGLLMIDESTHFTETMYKFLRSRVRIGGMKIDYKEAQKILPFLKKGFFPRILCCTNPGNTGHAWHKKSWVDAAKPYKTWKAKETDGGMKRVFIPAKLKDNPTMMLNDPLYAHKLLGMGNDRLVKAMLDGDWDVTSGGIIDDIWDKKIHVIKPFDVPEGYTITRCFDYGSTKPWALSYFAESDGTPIRRIVRGQVKEYAYPEGTLFVIAEGYGTNGNSGEGDRKTPSEIGITIAQIENSVSWGNRIEPGPSDNSIFTNLNLRDDGGVDSINDHILMGYTKERDENFYTAELFIRSDKTPGSRTKGFEIMRSYIKASRSILNGDMSEPGLFVCDICKHWIETVPTLPADPLAPTLDSPKGAIDHQADVCRYRLLHKPQPIERLSISGWW